MKEENHSKVESVINAERKSYLFRLRKKSFQDLELAKCKTTQEILQVTSDIQESQKIQRLAECVKTFHELQNPTETADGISIIPDDVGLITEQDLKDVGHIDELGNFSQVLRNELKSCISYNQQGFEITQEPIDSKLREIEEGQNTINDEIKKFDHYSGFKAYRRKIDSGEFAHVLIHGMQMPGNGMYYSSCLGYQMKGCVDSSHSSEHGISQDSAKVMRKKCNELSCPRCWVFAINKQAKAAVERIEVTLSFKKNKLWRRQRKSRIYNHLVVSLPKSKYDSCTTHKGRLNVERYVFRKLKEIGIEGGVSIYHPFRFTKNLESIYFSPHIHILGFGYTDKKNIKILYEKTGLFTKSIHTFNDSKTAFTKIRYLLSHVGVTRHKHRIKYFGDAGNNKFSTKTILAKSVSSIDDIGLHTISWKYLRRKIDGFYEDVPLSNVSLSLVSYDDESDIKSLREIDSDSFDLSVTSITDVQKRLQSMILHTDNPAKAKSTTFFDDEQQRIPNQFLHIRREYKVTKKSKTFYKYETILISFDESDICPICTRKLHLIEPIDPGGPNILDLPLGEIISVDCKVYRYIESFSDPRGQMYFDEDGVLLYDDGVPIPGPYHESLPNSVRSLFGEMIHRGKIKASLRLEKGRMPTIQEIDDVILAEQKIAESLSWHKTSVTSEKITKWFDDSLHLSDGKRG